MAEPAQRQGLRGGWEARRLGQPLMMGTTLYLFFEPVETGATLPAQIHDLQVPAFARFEGPLKPEIVVADEKPASVQLTFYTQNNFRIFVADLALQFHREIPPPPEVVAGERALREAVLRLEPLRLRRWIVTNEWWNDDDTARVDVLAEGTDPRTLEDVADDSARARE
jgi:hypothetical protein